MSRYATLKPAVLKKLLADGAVDSILIQSLESGFHILIRFDGIEKPIGLVKEDRARLFKTLERAEAHLTKFGIAHSSIASVPRSPPLTRLKKSDHYAIVKRKYEAIERNLGFHESVEEALAQVDAGTAVLIPWEFGDSMRALEAIRARHKQEGISHDCQPAVRRATALTLKPADLKDLFDEEMVDSVRIQDAEEGFSIRIGFGGQDKLLGLVKEDRARMFKTRKSAETHLKKLGIVHFSADATRPSPQIKPATRPGRGARTH